MVREGKRNDRLNILVLKRVMFDQCSTIFDLFL